MSTDLKIERFGAELANRLFTGHLVEGFVPHSLDDYSGVESELNDDIVRAVEVHMAFFGSYYSRVYQNSYYQFRLNQMDFLIFAMGAFPHQFLGKDVEEVMSKFVSSCAFLMDMCLVGIGRRDSNFLNKIHLIWAMFVDLELKDEFYASGGWVELRKYAWIYCKPAYRFMKCFSDGGGNVLRHRVDLTVQSLISMSHFHERYFVESDLPMGLQWADFVVKKPSVSARHRIEEIEDLEVFLITLKGLLDPFAANEMVYEELIPALEMVGMEERSCMDALASGDFGKYPEFKEVMQKKCEEAVLKVSECVLSDNSLVESTGETVDDHPVNRDRMNSGELDGGDWDISSKTVSKSLSGSGYLRKNCNEHIAHSPHLLPAFSLRNENETLLKSPIRENKERIIQEPILGNQSTETGSLSQVEESSGEHSIYNKLMESLQQNFPHLMKSISVSELSEIGQASGIDPITLSKVFSVLENSYNKRLRIVISDGVESEPKLDCSSGLSSLPKEKKRKTRRNDRIF